MRSRLTPTFVPWHTFLRSLAIPDCLLIQQPVIAAATNLQASPGTTSVGLTWTPDPSYPYTEVSVHGGGVVCSSTTSGSCTASGLQIGT